MSGVTHRCTEAIERLGRRLRDRGLAGVSGPFVVTAPLRICPLGAHVDHQGGVVTGISIDRSVCLVVAPADDPVIRAESMDFPGKVEIDLENAPHGCSGDWGDYLRGAVRVLGARFPLRLGATMVVAGDLPGSGLSSSAAVLVAYLLALSRLNDLGLSRRRVADLVQSVENSYIGVASGRLDQSIILYSERGSLTRVDCSDFQIDQVARPKGVADLEVLVAFSGVRRKLADSGFNSRVEECREAARLLLRLSGRAAREAPVLSEVPVDDFTRHAPDLPETLRRRAAHYFEEQQRVQQGVDAWGRGDLVRFGELMTASGASSINNFECGTAELISLYDLLREQDGVLGARFSGGGFGGSCIALIEQGSGRTIIDRVSGAYREAHPEAAGDAGFHVCRPDGAASVAKLEV